MSGLLSRCGALFLRPPVTAPNGDRFAVRGAVASNALCAPEARTPGRSAARRAAGHPPPERVAVLAAAPDLPALAGATAATLRRVRRAPAAAICVHDTRSDAPWWLPAATAPGPSGASDDRASAGFALPAARRTAARLSACGTSARALGCLCWVWVGGPADAAVATIARVSAALELPLVVALSERAEPLEPLLADADLIVAGVSAGAEAALVELAREELEALGPPVRVTRPPRGPARLAARYGGARHALDGLEGAWAEPA